MGVATRRRVHTQAAGVGGSPRKKTRKPKPRRAARQVPNAVEVSNKKAHACAEGRTSSEESCALCACRVGCKGTATLLSRSGKDPKPFLWSKKRVGRVCAVCHFDQPKY